MSKIIIESGRGQYFPNFREIFKYKQLLYSLAWRDIRVKYAQTYIGIIWAFINPIVNLIILSFVFGRIAPVDTGSVPHILFTISGLTAWTYFSTLLSDAGNSIVASQPMIKKIYFPRLVIPLSKAISGFLDFLIALICLVVIMGFYKVLPSKNVVWLPLFILFSLIAGLAGGIFVSALSIRFRDFNFVVPILVRIGMFATPIAYPAASVPESYKLIYFLNPMAGIVEGFRWSLLDVGSLDKFVGYSLLSLFVFFLISLLFFGSVERKMADIL